MFRSSRPPHISSSSRPFRCRSSFITRSNTIPLAQTVPLHIRVRVEGTTLVFENDLHSDPKPPHSTGIGLANMRERFRIATGELVVWGVEEGRFVVRLPLVSNDAATSRSRS